jgi:DNA-binding winged helix-turn-helix (wHTH) protein
MQEPCYRVSGLGLCLDPTLHRATRATRAGRRQSVDFGGNCRRWAVLMELAVCYPGYCSKGRLIDAVWAKSDPGFQGIEDGTIYATVSAVRRALRSVGITITFTKGLGYKLRGTRR